MVGLLTRLIVCQSVVFLSSAMFAGNVYYTSLYQIIGVGIVLAVAGYIMEVWLLGKINYWLITGMDLIAAAVIVYLSNFVFTGALITSLGALLTAFLLAITELIQLGYKAHAKVQPQTGLI